MIKNYLHPIFHIIIQKCHRGWAYFYALTPFISLPDSDTVPNSASYLSQSLSCMLPILSSYPSQTLISRLTSSQLYASQTLIVSLPNSDMGHDITILQTKLIAAVITSQMIFSSKVRHTWTKKE